MGAECEHYFWFLMLPLGGATADATAKAPIGRSGGMRRETLSLLILRGSSRCSRVRENLTVFGHLTRFNKIATLEIQL